MYIEIVSLLLVVIIAVLYSRQNRQSLPPGPSGLPLLGNILQIVKDPHLKLSQFVAKHGKLFTIRLGTKYALVISDAKIMKEIFSHSASTGKFQTDTFLLMTQGPYGVSGTEGEAWAEIRQFTIKCLTKHGFGSKTSLEPLIISEVQEVVDLWKREMKENGYITPIKYLRVATTNTLWTIVIGERFNILDSKIPQLLKDVMDGMQKSVQTGLAFLPWLGYIFPKASGYIQLEQASKNLHEFIENRIDAHKKGLSNGEPERCVIDSFIGHEPHVTDLNSSFLGEYGEKNKIASIADLFVAAGEAIPLTLDWLILYVCHHPQVQEKLHKEIDLVVGRYREPSLQDKPNMPYTQAVLLETLRKCSLAPLGIIHQLSEELEYRGYLLPEGMMLIPNMYHIHHDPEVWGDPHVFRPERFLDATETVVLKWEELVPFQAGKRICLGEPLAKDVIFLFTAKLFQAFQVTPDPDNPRADFDPDVGIALLAKPYKCLMNSRISCEMHE